MKALESSHQQGDGPFTVHASKMVSDLVGGGHVLLTPSCTHALEMASMLGNFGPGDEVIMPSYTFTSAATAITKFGAVPVFVDIDPITKGINANQVAEAVTSKTVGISWVNYAGVAPDINALLEIAKKNELILIEDNAHGLGGTYQGKQLGSFGDFATQSFHATKNIQCGEGGALVINSPKYIERAEIIREKGTDRKKFISGEVQKYQWVDKGSSYLLAESLAAILLGQLENFDSIQKTRKQQIEIYADLFRSFGIDEIDLPLRNQLINTSHQFYIEIPRSMREEIITNSKKSVNFTSHYVPLHSSQEGSKYQKNNTQFSNSNSLAEKIIRFPVHSETDIKNTHVRQIVEACKQTFPKLFPIKYS